MTPSSAESQATNESASEETQEITFFDKMYPHYASYPPEFKEEAIKTLKIFSNESRDFQNILLDELADEY